MSRPHILIFLPSLEGGGAERALVELANRFSAVGCRVDLGLASARGPYLGEVAEDVRVVELGGRKVRHSLRHLTAFLVKERPQAILSALDHANATAIAARAISGQPARCVISVRSIATAVYRRDRGIRRWGVLQATRISYRFADAVIANSHAVADDMRRSLRLPEAKLRVIYNALDIERIVELSGEKSAHPWLRDNDTPLILGVGSLTRLKDFPTLVRAFSLVHGTRRCRLAILGEGSERGELESLIVQLGLRHDVQLLGFVANPFVWMRHAALLVSSSLTEGCPNVLMQAFACGTAVVGTDCPGGSAEVLEGGRWGKLVPIGDPQRMAEAICSTLDFGEHPNVRSRALDFAIDEIARQYLAVLCPTTPMSQM